VKNNLILLIINIIVALFLVYVLFTKVVVSTPTVKERPPTQELQSVIEDKTDPFNAYYYEMNVHRREVPTITVIESAPELYNYYLSTEQETAIRQGKNEYGFERILSSKQVNLKDEIERYDDDYFLDKFLVSLKLRDRGNGSFKVAGIDYNTDETIITLYLYGSKDFMSRDWLIFIEINRQDCLNKTFRVNTIPGVY
jgi:hypothetical protein